MFVVAILEVGTPFYSLSPSQLPCIDSVADIGDAVVATAATAGFTRYEISAYAKDEKYCRHNLNYWQFGDYAGIGAGAHGKIHRYARIKHPAEYMRRAKTNAIAEESVVSGRDAAFEFMLNVLRLPDGFASVMLEERTGVGVLAMDNILTTAAKDGLLCTERDNIKPTEKGLRYLNDLLLRFLPNEKEESIKFV